MKLKLAALSSTAATAAALSVALAAVVMSFPVAHDFIVGAEDGWVENPSESFDHWARRNRFQVNDSLVFRYREQDSVLVVNEDDYRTCNTSNPERSFHGGQTTFRLTRPGPFFFIGGAAGQCEKGQKLVVMVMSVRRPKRGTVASPPQAFAPSGWPSTTPPSPAGFAPAGGPEGEAPPPVSGCSALASVSITAMIAVFCSTASFLV